MNELKMRFVESGDSQIERSRTERGQPDRQSLQSAKEIRLELQVKKLEKEIDELQIKIDQMAVENQEVNESEAKILDAVHNKNEEHVEQLLAKDNEIEKLKEMQQMKLIQ